MACEREGRPRRLPTGHRATTPAATACQSGRQTIDLSGTGKAASPVPDGLGSGHRGSLRLMGMSLWRRASRDYSHCLNFTTQALVCQAHLQSSDKAGASTLARPGVSPRQPRSAAWLPWLRPGGRTTSQAMVLSQPETVTDLLSGIYWTSAQLCGKRFVRFAEEGPVAELSGHRGSGVYSPERLCYHPAAATGCQVSMAT
jgi:hypothetical protein